MKKQIFRDKETLLIILSVYFIFLFLYTAFSKIATFDTFQFDLHRNPLIGYFFLPISYLLPIVEIVIAVYLFLKKEQRLGWVATIILMSLFTLYVAAILIFIPHKDIPCSCGGIIRFMSWRSHLIFNVFSTGLAIVGLIFSRRLKIPDKKGPEQSIRKKYHFS